MNPDIVKLIMEWVEALVKYEIEKHEGERHGVCEVNADWALRSEAKRLGKKIETALEGGGYVPVNDELGGEESDDTLP